MATNFPTSLDSFTNPVSTDTLNSPSHSGQHANINDAVSALEAKVGVNSSAVTTTLDYKVGKLTGGTTGQVLSKVSNTNYDTTWTTPAPTGASYVTLATDATLTSERVLTAGTGISVTDAGAGSTVTVATSAILPTLIDAKGDLLVGTANDTVARLAVGGTNGWVLTVDSTATEGVRWAAASGSSTDSDQNILAVQVFS